VDQANCLFYYILATCRERFAIEQISDVMETHNDHQNSLNDRMVSDTAGVKAELSALKARVADKLYI